MGGSSCGGAGVGRRAGAVQPRDGGTEGGGGPCWAAAQEGGGQGHFHRTPCAGCDCSTCGTETCDPHSGHCVCKAGVTGPRCDRCRVGLPGRVGPAGRGGACGPARAEPDSTPYRRKDTSASRTAGAAARAPVDRLRRAPSATPRVGSATAGQGLEEPSAVSAPPATGGCLSRAAGVSMDRWGGVGWPVPQDPLPATHHTLPHLGCQCQGGHCDVHTGRCTCPPGLSGERCDTCSQQHQVPVPGGPGGWGARCEGASLCSSPAPLCSSGGT